MSDNEHNKLDNDENTQEDAPPLPDEDAPPLPDEQPPLPEEDEPPLPEGEEPPQSSAQAAQPQVLQGTNGWSAIFEPQSQRYYYYNQTTGVTTWDNPFSNIQKEEDKSSNKRQFYQEEDDAIDPDLAHLLPSSSKDPHGYVQAKFNTRTGQFNSKSWQTPEHVSAINKSRRQQGALSIFAFVTSTYNPQLHSLMLMPSRDKEMRITSTRKRKSNNLVRIVLNKSSQRSS